MSDIIPEEPLDEQPEDAGDAASEQPEDAEADAGAEDVEATTEGPADDSDSAEDKQAANLELEMPARPGGALAARELHFIWIADCSGSMGVDGKIEALNNAIDEAVPHMRDVADENPFAQLLVRAITFSTGAQWHVSQPTPIEDFEWEPVEADGVTDLGQALGEVAEQLSVNNMPERSLPPVLVLTSDGQPTDDYKSGLQRLMDQPWGKKAVRIGIAIGQDADLDCLQEFIGNIEFPPLQASNADRLAQLIKWASTAVVNSASSPVSKSSDAEAILDLGNVVIPLPPDEEDLPDSVSDVW